MLGAAAIDDESVNMAAGGDRTTLSQVVEILQPQIRLMVAARLCPTPAQLDSADEIVQEVSLAIVTGLERLENRTVDGLRAFVSAIVTKQVANFLKRRETGRRLLPGHKSLDSTVGTCSNAGPLWQFLSSSGTSPISAADRADRVARLFAELGRLKDDHREVIILAFCDQLSPREIGLRLGLSRQAASMLLLRAFRTLRRYVASGMLKEDVCGIDISKRPVG